MFAYCGNNPVSYIDPLGYFDITAVFPYLEEFLNWLIEGIVGTGIILLGLDQAATSSDQADAVLSQYLAEKEKVDAKAAVKVEAEAAAITKRDYRPVRFPVDPTTFHPLGLIMVVRSGSKNGEVITWMDPLSNTAQFRWDENPNYPNGSHYHVLVKWMGIGKKHFLAGEPVPEPAASIYFPLR